MPKEREKVYIGKQESVFFLIKFDMEQAEI